MAILLSLNSVSMENLAAFHKIIYGDDSPLHNSPNDYSQHLAFLKNRYPDGEKHYKVKLRRIGDQGFEICHFQEFCFSDLENIIYHDGTPGREKPMLTSITEAVCQKIGFKAEDILHSNYYSEQDTVHFEANIKIAYEDLPVHEVKFHYYKTLLFEAVRDVYQKLHNDVFAFRSEKEIKLYLKNHHALHTGYVNVILRDFIPKEHWNSLYQISTEHTVIDIFKMIIQQLEDILAYIEQSFACYLDLNLAVPYKSRLIFAMEYSEKLSEVLNHLEHSEMDGKLREIVLRPFESLGEFKPYTFSYQDQQYHETYLLAFYQAIKEGRQMCRKSLILILWQVNFNAPKFFKYLTYRIHLEIQEKQTIEEKLMLLHYYQKLCNQLAIKTQLCYNTHLLPLKDQMSQWLKEEIYYLKNQGPNTLLENQEKKIQVKMSVAQLSLVARALFETGLIDGTRKDLLRFLSSHFRTDQQGNISVDSLTGKYYKIETSTKRSVGRMMKKMLAHIENPAKIN